MVFAPVNLAQSTRAGLMNLWRLPNGTGMVLCVVLFNVVLLGGISVVLGGLVQQERDDAIRAAEERNDNLAIALEAYTTRTLESADAVLRYLIREKLRTSGNVDLDKFVSDYTIDSHTFIGLVLADEHGDGYTTAFGNLANPNPNPNPRFNVADREHFKVHVTRVSDSLLVGKPVIARNSNRMVVPLTRRISKADGSFGGVAMILIEPRRFTDVLQYAKRNPLDVTSLVGLDGITRARLTRSISSAGEDVSKSPLFAEQARHPVGKLVATGAIDGVSKYFSYRTVPNFPLMVITGTAEADVFARFRQVHAQYDSAAALASAVIVIFSLALVAALNAQRRAAARVAESEARYRAAFNQSSVGIIHSSLDLRIQEVNPKICSLLGYSHVELLARTVEDITHPEDIPRHKGLKESLEKDPGGQGSVQFEKRYLCKDGSAVWCELALSLVRDAHGDPLYFSTVVLDISDRKRAEAALAAHEYQERRLAQQVKWDRARLIEAQAVAKVGSWETNLATMEVEWSDENYRIFGVDRNRFRPTHAGFMELVHPDDRPAVDAAFVNSIGGRAPCEIEHRIVSAAGSTRFVEERWRIFRDEQDRPVRAVGTTQDITERRRAETALRISNARLKVLSGRLQRAEENERKRISRELHDQAGQELTALMLDLAALRKGAMEHSELVQRCQAGVERLLAQLRDLTLALRPPQLDDFGLVSALRGHLEESIAIHGIEVHLSAEGTERKLSPELEGVCFRIAQEALTNVLRHAAAKNVWVALRETDRELCLEVRDDGRGFEPKAALDAAADGRSSGVRNLHDRAELAGGTLLIESAPGAGTRIEAKLPWPDLPE